VHKIDKLKRVLASIVLTKSWY